MSVQHVLFWLLLFDIFQSARFKMSKKRELLLYLAIQLIRNTPGTFLMLSKTLTARFLSLAKNFSADKLKHCSLCLKHNIVAVKTVASNSVTCV